MQVSAPSAMAVSQNQFTKSSQSWLCVRLPDFNPKCISVKQATFLNNDAVSVKIYNELTAEFAKKFNAKFLLRGLRNTTDFEYENSIAQVNRHLNKELETVFLITSPAFASVSSSIIREVHKYGGDVSDFIPYELWVPMYLRNFL